MKITYADKVALNENSSIAEINKVTAENMNEIKTVVNGLISNTYGTSQTTGYSQEYVNGLSILGLKYNKTLTTGVNTQRIKITCTKNFQCFFLYGQGGCLCSVTNMSGGTPQISGFANNTTATGDKISQLQLYITVGTGKEIYVYSNDDFSIEEY